MGGETDSDDFPVTENAFAVNHESSFDGFSSVFDPIQVRLDYSTYIPGNYQDQVSDITVTSESVLWIGGFTSSSDFRVTDDALQSQNASGGGPSSGLSDGFFMQWDLTENQLLYSSYLGGSGSDFVGDLYPLDSGRIVVVGATQSHDFPVTANALDTILSGNTNGFITIIQLPDTILHSTYWGGGGVDVICNISATHRGALVFGTTTSGDFPVTQGAFDTIYNNGQPSGNEDVFISRLSADLSRLEYSTYLGGGGPDHCYGGLSTTADTVWVFGYTESGDFPTTENAFQSQFQGWRDVFFTKFAIPDTISPVTIRPSPIPFEISLNIYPNPFNSTAQISFMLPTTQHVSLQLHDVLGREVAVLLNERQTAGEHRMSFNGSALSSGVYFCRMEAGREMRTQKIVLMK